MDFAAYRTGCCSSAKGKLPLAIGAQFLPLVLRPVAQFRADGALKYFYETSGSMVLLNRAVNFGVAAGLFLLIRWGASIVVAEISSAHAPAL